MAKASRQAKNQSRERILRSAARLLRERGIGGASVGDVMTHAGLTHGGFYRHFANKDALVEGALDAAFQEIIAPLQTDSANPPSSNVGERFRAFYLSNGHLKQPGQGCPAAALSGEVARAPASTKRSFGAGVRAMLTLIARTKNGDDDFRDAEAARELAMMVGAMTIARASDPDTADFVLAACRNA